MNDDNRAGRTKTMGRRRWGVIAGATAVAATVAVLAAGLPATAVPPSADATPRGVADATGKGATRIVLGEDFASTLASKGVRVVPLGEAKLLGERTLEIPLGVTERDGYEAAGGFRLESGTGRFSCPRITVYPRGDLAFCLREDGDSLPLFGLSGEAAPTYAAGYFTDSPRAAAMASGGISTRINDALGVRVATAGAPVGEIRTVRKRPPLKASYDWRTGCEIDDWAGDNSINRGWALQAMVNLIPQGVTVSQTGVQNGRAVVTTPTAPDINVGQRTPKMEQINVTDSKKFIRGSQYSTDHFYEGYAYSCHTNAPFVVGFGDINSTSVKTWNYDGSQRKPTDSQKPQWWAHPRQTDYNGPTGWYTWACRGTPNGKTGNASNAFWGKVDSGTGFVGDGQDRNASSAGRAPGCQDNVMKDLKFTTRYSISKRGGLEERNDSDYPRDCTVEGAAPVGCWQEIYSGGWLRAWAFQYKIFATAMRAELSSETRITVPGAFDPDNAGFSKPLSWRIVDASINNGTWPSFTSEGKEFDFSDAAFTKSQDRQDWATLSPYTVPGSRGTFTLGGWGTPEGMQTMSFLLVGDSDGTWQWPVNQSTGEPLERPRVRVNLNFKVSNFDDGGSCNKKIDGDNSLSATDKEDTRGRHCIQGVVPTLWPLPADASNNWRRIHDANAKPSITTEVKPLASVCWNTEKFAFNDESKLASVPDVGADFTWRLFLAGSYSNYAGAGCGKS